MKIGVISDTHIPSNCENIYDKIKKCFQGVDMIIHAGDITELNVLDELSLITPNVVAVCGNMDSEPVRRKLPLKRIINAGKFKIGLIHGSGAPKQLAERMAGEFNKVDVIIFGHSHMPVNETKKGVLFFNPGSATDTVMAEKRTVGILKINDTIEGEIISI